MSAPFIVEAIFALLWLLTAFAAVMGRGLSVDPDAHLDHYAPYWRGQNGGAA